jgi:hypothetical protein
MNEDGRKCEASCLVVLDFEENNKFIFTELTKIISFEE